MYLRVTEIVFISNKLIYDKRQYADGLWSVLNGWNLLPLHVGGSSCHVHQHRTFKILKYPNQATWFTGLSDPDTSHNALLNSYTTRYAAILTWYWIILRNDIESHLCNAGPPLVSSRGEVLASAMFIFHHRFGCHVQVFFCIKIEKKYCKWNTTVLPG